MKKRVKTHIQGFDELIEGGFTPNFNILLTGTPGTGKTIFSLSYLYNGATKDKEVGVYFTFEERKKDLFSQAEQFGWNLEKLEKKGLLRVISLGTEDIEKSSVEEILEIIKETKAKRVVIDSITTLSYLSPKSAESIGTDEHKVKKFLYDFVTKFKECEGITSMFISQKNDKLSNSIAEYLCDGIINISYETLGGDFSRNLTVSKMRQTNNDEDLHPLEISKEGIIVHNLE